MNTSSPSDTRPTPLVEAAGLVLAHGDAVAVEASSFTVPRGSVTAIIGPNGSGKSTLLNAIGGLLAPRSGTLRVLGGSPAEAWRRTTYVMQSVDFPLGVPITVREVVGMGRYPSAGWFKPFSAADRERIEKSMAELDITDLAHRHLGELSGGQRQRVFVAQGIAQDHELVLLDEPLTGLDVTSARTIDNLIHSETSKGHSVILTTHDLEEARAADQVILMSGRVVAAGPPATVCTRTNLEVAYGLGSLHEPEIDFIDDPHRPHH